MPKPYPTFYGILWWMSLQSRAIETFRVLAREGLPSAVPVAETRVENTVKDFTEGIEHPDPERFKRGIRKGLVTDALGQAGDYLDAASLIFMHAMADDAISACIRLAVAIDPGAWEHHLSDKKFKLRRIKTADYATLRAQALEWYMASLMRKSLPKRTESLFSVCPPVDRKTGEVLLDFDMNQLIRADTARHEIVHDHKVGSSVGFTEKDLESLQYLGWVGIVAVRGKYRDSMKEEHMGDLPPPGTW